MVTKSLAQAKEQYKRVQEYLNNRYNTFIPEQNREWQKRTNILCDAYNSVQTKICKALNLPKVKIREGRKIVKSYYFQFNSPEWFAEVSY